MIFGLILSITWQYTACPLQLCQLGCTEWTFLTWQEWPKCLPKWLHQFTPLKFPLPIFDNSWYHQTFFIIANLIRMTWCHIVLIKFPWVLGRFWSLLMLIGHWASSFICTHFYCFLLFQWIENVGVWKNSLSTIFCQLYVLKILPG